MTPPPTGTAVPDLPGLSSLSPLGRGGFADVYLAHQAHLDRWVAAKVFRVALADRRANDQFRAECQAVGRLDRHPHVITVYEANVLPDGRPYMVTEHCDGSLHQLVTSNGSLPASRVVDIGLTVARALLFAHGARVLHGDVTPQNILLRASGAPVLADFGLAVLRDYQGNVASGFTMAHAAPETVRYDGAIDERTDVYGLGSTLYAAVTGRPPFPARPGEDDAARAHRILTETPAGPSAAPPGLSRLLLAMLAKDPDDRPSMTSVADGLAALQDGGAAPVADGVAPPGQAAAPGGSPWTPPGAAADPDRGPSYLAPSYPAPGAASPGPSPHTPPPAPGRSTAAAEAGSGAPPTPGRSADIPERSAGPAEPGGGAWAPPPPARERPFHPSPGQAPWTGGGEDTRSRAVGGPAAPPAGGGEQTRLRPGSTPQATGPARGRRPWVLAGAVAAVVVVLAGIAAVLLWPDPSGTQADARPAPAGGATITLAPPVDRGDTVELTWSSDATLDYAVVVGEQGRPEPVTTLVGRATTFTAPVAPGQPYCFRVQGVTPAGSVSQSNVVSVRDAVCRFDS